MGKIMNRVKGVTVVGASAIAGLMGIELGAIGGVALYNDVRFVIGKAPHPVYSEGTIIKKYTRVNPYTGEKTRVKYSKKQNEYVATKWQPKGYVK